MTPLVSNFFPFICHCEEPRLNRGDEAISKVLNLEFVQDLVLRI